MVRTLIKGLLVLLVIVGVSPFILPLKDGQPLVSVHDIAAPGLPALPEVDLPLGAPAQVIVHRWKDAEGRWAYSNEAPPPGVSYETIIADTDNPPQTISGAKAQAPADGSTAETPLAVPSPYSPEKIQKLLQDARGVQALLDAQKERLDSGR